jgi:16S rRNA (cytosine967-C5)-methyltransferase
MDRQLLTLAATVISQSDREHPADQMLRQVLTTKHGPAAANKAQVARAVFSYYRWLRWLDPGLPMHRQIERATELAELFRRDPRRFQDEELRKRAIPDWTKKEVESAAAWVRSLQSEPRLWLRARPGEGRSVARKLRDCRIPGGAFPADTLEYQGSTDLFRTPAFQAGEFELQDISSQAVGFICAPRPGETWWDACAGEGGKTLHLSALMGNKGLIWASDRAAWRLQKLKRRAGRAGAFNYRTALWDETPRLPTKTKFDGVLVDAPCSGIGTWQRNPHARWTTTLKDVRELAAVQGELLARAATALKPGGKLVYSVCTLARSETVAIAEQFETQFAGFTPLAVPNPLANEHPPAARLFLWPQEFGGNGMFVAVWRAPARLQTDGLCVQTLGRAGAGTR